MQVSVMRSRQGNRRKRGNWYETCYKKYGNWIRKYEKTFFTNFIVNASLKGSALQKETEEKEDCNVPWAILLDPTSACNLHCTGCWAAEYGHKLNLSLETIDDIITQGKETWYIYVYLYRRRTYGTKKKILLRSVNVILTANSYLSQMVH